MNAADAPTSKIVDSLPVPFGAGEIPVGVWAGTKEIGSGSVTHYFVENAELYGAEGRGPGLYGNQQGDYPDNDIRFSVFPRAALEISRRIFPADVFHCHDWQAGLLPVFLRETLAGDPDFARAKTLFTIHNLGYQGLFPASRFGEIGLQAFYLAQIGGPLPQLLLAVGFLRMALYEIENGQKLMEEVARGFAMGRQARTFFGVHWDELWSLPLAEVRRRLNVQVDEAAPVLKAA